MLTGDSDFEDEGVVELENSQEHRNPSIEEAPKLELKLPPDLLCDVQFRRLSQRIADMHDIHRRFAQDLTQALASAFRSTRVEVDWPVFALAWCLDRLIRHPRRVILPTSRFI